MEPNTTYLWMFYAAFRNQGQKRAAEQAWMGLLKAGVVQVPKYQIETFVTKQVGTKVAARLALSQWINVMGQTFAGGAAESSLAARGATAVPVIRGLWVVGTIAFSLCSIGAAFKDATVEVQNLAQLYVHYVKNCFFRLKYRGSKLLRFQENGVLLLHQK